MACCLMTPSHYTNHCWLIIKCVLWHLPESDFKKNVPMNLIYSVCSEIIILKSMQYFPEANEFNQLIGQDHSKCKTNSSAIISEVGRSYWGVAGSNIKGNMIKDIATFEVRFNEYRLKLIGIEIFIDWAYGWMNFSKVMVNVNILWQFENDLRNMVLKYYTETYR